MAKQSGPIGWDLGDPATPEQETAEIVEGFNQRNGDVLNPLMERLRFHAATKNYDDIALIGVALQGIVSGIQEYLTDKDREASKN